MGAGHSLGPLAVPADPEDALLLTYLDEVGEPGAYIGPDHPRFHTSPGFGYAGFVLPDSAAREIGAYFDRRKRELFATELAAEENPGRWERKGASVFRPETIDRYPQQLRVFASLVSRIRARGGYLFYYVDEKPLGTPKQTRLDPEQREAAAMGEALNRLARHADRQASNILILIDQVNEKTRQERIARMYGHIFSRSTHHAEMRRIVEPPMHVDSRLSAGIQLANWVAACVTRTIDYQLVRTSRHRWIVETNALAPLRGSFTHESKLHYHERSIEDLNHSQIFNLARPLYPAPSGQNLATSIDPDVARKMRRIAYSSRTRSHSQRA